MNPWATWRRSASASAVLLASVAACGSGDPGAIRVSMDELASGVEVTEIDDPQAAVLLAEALVVDGGPPAGIVGVDRDPQDDRFDVLLSYRTGGCPALPRLTAEVVDATLRLEVEIVDPGGDCDAAEYIEAIGIDLAPEAEELPIAATLG